LTGTKIDGLVVAQAVKERVKKAVEEIKSQGISPCLATVLVGDNQASATYVKNKQKACAEVGIATKDHHPPASISQKELNDLIDSLNNDRLVHGILVQLPLPDQINEFEAISRISPIKDVEPYTIQCRTFSYGKSCTKGMHAVWHNGVI
jgi:methylenetetrahydrofolate dehydrogenase (NADP+) / methenyltetrahydrofolate cyclohydrolase